MIDTATSVMEPAVRSGATDAPIAAPWYRRRPAAGKTVLLRSRVCAAGLAERPVWVPVQGERRDPQPFWVPVADALRGMTADAELGRPNAFLTGSTIKIDGGALVSTGV